MSMHSGDYLALLTRAKEWAIAHPVIAVAVAAFVIAFALGRYL